jgi:NADH-quinone oxidoreductase subunit I
MLHDENNEHACTGCTACELGLPNATIKIITKFDVTPKAKRRKQWTHLFIIWNCVRCVIYVLRHARQTPIKMAQNFEHSVYDRSQLTKKLNKPGSKIREGVE